MTSMGTQLDHIVPLARSGAVEGALTGGVVGLFLLAHLLGAAVEGAAGAIGGKLSQLGLDQLVVKDILNALEPAARRSSCYRTMPMPPASRRRFAHNTRR
jgi:uncharacterized membrane protein